MSNQELRYYKERYYNEQAKTNSKLFNKGTEIKTTNAYGWTANNHNYELGTEHVDYVSSKC